MGRKTKKLQARACDRCAALVDKLTRVRLSEGGDWIMVCDACWKEVAPGNPGYTYGGVWKARKRR